MKKISLNKTWKLCLSMWRWIAEEKKEGNTASVEWLKDKWLEQHGFETDSIVNDCFFCGYEGTHRTKIKSVCEGGFSGCPGRKVDLCFDCMNINYNYNVRPIAFYNKLRSLNRKRLTK